jgi:membrane associated rhomboid family serine protease
VPEGDSPPIRNAPTRARADEWALVLTSQGLHPTTRRTRDGFDLDVPDDERASAEAALSAYERENPPAPPPPELPPPPNWIAGALLALTWIAFLRITGPRDPAVSWFAHGSADAARILAGETWRATTALTLHADLAHALGNALAGTLFIGSVFGAFGIGLGLAVVVSAGVLGNFANAAFHATNHSSVGASTAIFAAVGVLAAMGVARHQQRGIVGRRALVPIAAGLGLLAMLGTSQRADLSGHLFGLLAGIVLGLPCARAFPHPPSPIVQWTLTLTVAAWLVSNWSAALP